MNKVVMVLVGLAAAIFISRFAWSFKVTADQKAAAEQAEANRIIDMYVQKCANADYWAENYKECYK